MGVNLSAVASYALDLTTEEIEYLLKLSKNFKDMKRAGVPHRYLEGKNIVLLFQKTSTRTRCAFEVGGTGPGHGRHLPRSRFVADGQEGVHRGHRPRSRPHV